MKNSTISLSLILIVILGFGSLTAWHGDTAVALEPNGDILYRQIENGRIGANCYDEDHNQVIAPSKLLGIIFGPEWTEVAKLNKSGKTYSITCYPYLLSSISKPKSASFQDS